jgi:hypothetical protein
MTNEQTTEEAITKYGGLSNGELMLVYFRFKKYLDTLENNLNNNQISKQIDTPLGKATAFINVSDDNIEKFKSSEYYKLTKTLVQKLEPIVELLIECDSTYKKLADELR